MYYTENLVLEKLKKQLPSITFKKEEKNKKEIYIFNYKNKKVSIDLNNFLTRLDDKQSEKSDKLLKEFLFYIKENLEAQANFSLDNVSTTDFLTNAYPIIRATTFGKNSSENFVTKEHTSETKIFFSYDLGNSYRLITTDMLEHFNIKQDILEEAAFLNLKKLPLKYNTDEVAGNIFYFLNAKDGYDGSRILNKDILNYFHDKIGADYYLGVPNQDAVIIADIKNKSGLEILQKIMVHFFTDGRVPITTITFKYDRKNIESLFIFVE